MRAGGCGVGEGQVDEGRWMRDVGRVDEGREGRVDECREGRVDEGREGRVDEGREGQVDEGREGMRAGGCWPCVPIIDILYI